MAGREKKGDAEEFAESALDQLKRDLDREVNEIRATIREKGPAAVEESIRNLQVEFDRRFGDLRDQLDESVETSRRLIRHYPLTAVGGAVVVGILIGLLLGRGRKS